ncbi:SMI1/KNR4 family protein [Paenibacillus sp. MMO-58]|uniref:SMI1/KNR4 family protein n=1 Tax=Paenibacillus sp. MMO-58 TaxID=3081290 RepID=UPI0030187FFC
MDFSKLNGPEKYEGAGELELLKAEKELGGRLPILYKMLLKRLNGCLLENGVCLYGTEDLSERNSTWEVAVYAKGFVAIGDDSGGTVLLMPFEEDSTEIIAVDAGDMNPSNGVLVTADIANWIEDGCQMAY